MDWSWATDGITELIPRSTGPECGNYLTTRRKIFECIIINGFCIWLLKWSIQKLEPITLLSPYQQKKFIYQQQQQQQQQYLATSSSTSSTKATGSASKLYNNNLTTYTQPLGKQILLITMTFVFGMEMGFKLATKTVIYILNPCHITTIIQIYLLAARPNKWTTILFRVHMNYLNGPFLAFLFPDAESRHLPLEQATYWLQHGLMFIIPIYLLRLGGAYNMEYIFDFKWNIIGFATMIIYHFTVLQFFSVISNVNLNYTLCPSISDPFQGFNYRIAAFIHQAILCPILCKLFTIIFSKNDQIHHQLDVKIIKNHQQHHEQQQSTNDVIYSSTNDGDDCIMDNYDNQNPYDSYHHHHSMHYHPSSSSSSSNNQIYGKVVSSSSSFISDGHYRGESNDGSSVGSLLNVGNIGKTRFLSSSTSSLIGHSIATSGLTTATAAVLPSSSSAATAAAAAAAAVTNLIPPVTISRIDDPIMTTKID